MKASLLLLSLVCLSLTFALPKRFDGDKIVKVHVSNEQVQQWLLDYFDVFEARYESFDVHVDGEQFELLKGLGLQVDVLVDDLQKMVDMERPASVKNLTWFEEYHTYEELKQHYNQLANENGATFIPSIGKV